MNKAYIRTTPINTRRGFAVSHSLQSNNWTHLAVVLRILGFSFICKSGSLHIRKKRTQLDLR